MKNIIFIIKGKMQHIKQGNAEEDEDEIQNYIFLYISQFK